MRPQKEIKYQMKVLSSLEKVFPDEEPVYKPECIKLSGLWGETISYQIAYTGAGKKHPGPDHHAAGTVE